MPYPAKRDRKRDNLTRLVCGVNPVCEALKAHPDDIEKIIVSSGRRGIERLIDLAENSSVKIEYRPKEELNRVSRTFKHQGILAILGHYKYVTIDKIIKKWKSSGDKALILVLDGMQDPQNLGSLVRTANACNAHGVVIPKDRAVGITSTVVKASAGATEHTFIARVTNIATTLKFLRKEGVWIVGAAGGEVKDIYSTDIDLNTDIVLVIGGEGKGIRTLVKKRCDFLVSIPMLGEVPSLNASVAGAVILYEVMRRRISKKLT